VRQVWTRSEERQLEHDPEKWKPVSRLREALSNHALLFDASAGESRSEKIMLLQHARAPIDSV
jgi:hypothetical protein